MQDGAHWKVLVAASRIPLWMIFIFLEQRHSKTSRFSITGPILESKCTDYIRAGFGKKHWLPRVQDDYIPCECFNISLLGTILTTAWRERQPSLVWLSCVNALLGSPFSFCSLIPVFEMHFDVSQLNALKTKLDGIRGSNLLLRESSTENQISNFIHSKS